MIEKVPEEVLKELDIGVTEEEEFNEVTTMVVESHQIKFAVPKKIRLELTEEKTRKVKVRYNPKTKQLIYQL